MPKNQPTKLPTKLPKAKPKDENGIYQLPGSKSAPLPRQKDIPSKINVTPLIKKQKKNAKKHWTKVKSVSWDPRLLMVLQSKADEEETSLSAIVQKLVRSGLNMTKKDLEFSIKDSEVEEYFKK